MAGPPASRASRTSRAISHRYLGLPSALDPRSAQGLVGLPGADQIRVERLECVGHVLQLDHRTDELLVSQVMHHTRQSRLVEAGRRSARAAPRVAHGRRPGHVVDIGLAPRRNQSRGHGAGLAQDGGTPAGIDSAPQPRRLAGFALCCRCPPCSRISAAPRVPEAIRYQCRPARFVSNAVSWMASRSGSVDRCTRALPRSDTRVAMAGYASSTAARLRERSNTTPPATRAAITMATTRSRPLAPEEEAATGLGCTKR